MISGNVRKNATVDFRPMALRRLVRLRLLAARTARPCSTTMSAMSWAFLRDRALPEDVDGKPALSVGLLRDTDEAGVPWRLTPDARTATAHSRRQLRMKPSHSPSAQASVVSIFSPCAKRSAILVSV